MPTAKGVLGRERPGIFKHGPCQAPPLCAAGAVCRGGDDLQPQIVGLCAPSCATSVVPPARACSENDLFFNGLVAAFRSVAGAAPADGRFGDLIAPSADERKTGPRKPHRVS